MLDEHVELFEAAFIEQQGDALAGGQLALLVLGGDTALAAALTGLLAAAFQFFQDVLHGASFDIAKLRRFHHPCGRSGK